MKNFRSALPPQQPFTAALESANNIGQKGGGKQKGEGLLAQGGMAGTNLSTKARSIASVMLDVVRISTFLCLSVARPESV